MRKLIKRELCSLLTILAVILLAAPAYGITPVFGVFDGPSSSTNNAIARFDGTTGQLIQNSSATLDDSGNIVANSIKVEAGTVGSPGIMLGTGGGLFQGGDNSVEVSLNNLRQFVFFSIDLFADNAAGAQIRNLASTTTVPTVNPRRNDNKTGLGSGAPSQLSVITNSVEGIRVTESGGNATVTFPDGYTRHHDIGAGAATTGPTAPTLTTIGTMIGLAFDADAELAGLNVEVPEDWIGTSDMTLTVHWVPEAGAAMTNGQTVIWDARYHSVTVGEAIDAGTLVTASATYTQSGAGTDKEDIATDITIDYDHADQPLTSGDTLTILFDRDMTGDSYGSDAVVIMWELEYTATGMPQH